MTTSLHQALLGLSGGVTGSESEATHYSTWGGMDLLFIVRDNTVFYWKSLSKGWFKSALELDQITKLGEKEPEFRCGPPKPKKPKARISYSNIKSEIYDSTRRYKGD